MLADLRGMRYFRQIHEDAHFFPHPVKAPAGIPSNLNASSDCPEAVSRILSEDVVALVDKCKVCPSPMGARLGQAVGPRGKAI